ncbi:MAG TPA: carboxypeptidase regulatory-like domain-containing protein, partial [Polyangiaceae bacterium]|nr:carboxypeptidase regulatory-like domain-containing protein [Polyangiaceae bacterium]
RTDAQGRAEVGRLGEAPWVVTVRAPGYDETTARGVRDGAALKLTLRRLGSITVTVVDAANVPVKSARVRIAGASLWPAREGRTGEHGMVKLAGLFAGSYALRATFETQASPIELGLMLSSGENKELTLHLAPGRMVVVHTTDGEADDAEDVSGARVVLAEGGLSPFPIEGVTGRNGRVSLGPIAQGQATLSARADGYVGRAVSVPEPLTGEVRVVLARAGAVVGRVVDARGFPIGGATVELIGNDFAGQPIDDDPRQAGFRDAQFAATVSGPAPLVPAGDLGVVPGPVPPIPHGPVMSFGAGPQVTSASLAEPWVSAGDGTFRASPATPGRVRVLVRHPEYVEAWSDVVTVPAGGEAHVEVVLRAGGSVEGRVLDPQGRPVVGARVELLAVHGTLERSARSSSDGTFAFAAVPKDVSLDVYADDEATAPALRTTLTVVDGERKEVTLTLPGARETVRYRVRDDRGYPVGAAQVSLTSLDVVSPLRETSFSDANGEGQLAGARGLPSRLEVSAPGHAPKVLTLDAAPADLDVTLSPAASLSGTVRDRRGGDPVADAEVVLYGAAGVRHLRTDAAGAFSAADLAPGPSRVRVSAKGYAPAERAITVAADERPQTLAPIDLGVEGGVDGEVLDARGDPVQGARVAKDRVPVYLASSAPPEGIAITDARGRFHLGGLGDGSVSLEAYAPEVGRGRTDGVAIQSGRTTSRVRIVLHPEGGATTAPAASATVAVTLGETSGDPHEVVVVLVADGSEAERAGLLAGDTLLEVDGAAVHSLEAARTRLNGPQTLDVLLTLRRDGKTLRLRVGREPTRR